MLLADKPYDEVEEVFEEALEVPDNGNIVRTWAVSNLHNLVKQNFRTDEVRKLLAEVFGEQ